MKVLALVLLLWNISIANSSIANNYFDTYPYLSYSSNNTKNEITISFYTKELLKSKLTYTANGKTRTVVNDKSPSHKHVFVLQDLAENTHFQYEIDNVYSNSFHTSSGKFKEFKIVTMGHTGGTQPIDTYPLSLVSTFIEKLDPDFILHNGDLVWEPYLWEFKHFINTFKQLSGKYPIMVSPANHEIVWPWDKDDLNYKNFATFFKYPDNGLLYSYEYNGVLFISLPYYEDFSPNSISFKKLKSFLGQKEYKYKVVYLGGGQNTWFKDRNIENLFPYLKINGVDLIIAGDSNKSYMKYSAGINYIFTGSNVRKLFPVNLVQFNENTIVFKQMTPDNRIIRSDSFFSNREKKITIKNISINKKLSYTGLNIENNFNYGDSGLVTKIKAQSDVKGQLVLNAGSYTSILNVWPSKSKINFFFNVPKKINPSFIAIDFKTNTKKIKEIFLYDIKIYKYNTNKYNLLISADNINLEQKINKVNFKMENIGSAQLEAQGSRGAYLVWHIKDKDGKIVLQSKKKGYLFGLKSPGSIWYQKATIDARGLQNASYTLVVDFWHIGLGQRFESLGSKPFIKKIKITD